MYIKADAGGRIIEIGNRAYSGFMPVDWEPPGSIMDERGVYLYKLDNGIPRECTPEEIAEQEANLPEMRPSIPEEVETLKNENTLLKAQIQAMSDRNDFIEDCIAEMAMQVYA